MKDYLKEVAEKINIVLSEKQLEQFQIYYYNMIETNKVMNLTSITDEKDVVIKHFIDSISIMNYYDFSNCDSIIDVGTGAGFPGIPLSIMLPGISFTLMDSLNKRIKFLNQIIIDCKLKNIKTVHSRAEDLGHNPQYREKYDVCVSRAVANLSVLLEYCIPFVKKDGYFISYKSILAEDELKQSKSAQKKLLCKLSEEITFHLESTDYYRSFLVFKKMDNLNKKYPRQAGTPKKIPL